MDELMDDGRRRQVYGELAATAALVHTFPHLRARVLVDGRPVLLVQRNDPLVDGMAMDVPVMTPCRFRSTVVQARDLDDLDARLALGLLPGRRAVVDIGLPPGGCLRPGGLQRIPVEGQWVWAITTTLPAPEAYDAGADLVAGALPLGGLVALGIHPDDVTGVSVAYAVTTAAPGSAGEAATVDLLEGLLARWTVHELTREVAAHG